MALTDLISKIILEDGFSGTFDQYEKRLTNSEGKINKFGVAVTKFATVAGAVGGAAVGTLAAVDRLTDSAVQNQQAMFNVAYAAAAANREFGNGVGTVDSWTASVAETSDQLRVFGDKEVAAATSRLIDMTKRLGFSEEQMQVLLTRTGDLAAGKTDLVGGIERTTSAMRGEAESAEYLGLSLNENTVKAYAESHGLLWKNLSDTEKAQQRYALFLEQTDTLQGRAAESANTLLGREAEAARLRERTITQIGQGLLPLREGEIGLWRALGVEGDQVGKVIAAVLIGMQAQLLAVSAALKTYYDSLIRGAGVAQKAIVDIFAGEDIGQTLRSAGQGIQDEFNNIAKGFSVQANAADFFDQLWADYERTTQATADLGAATEDTGRSYDQFAGAATAAVQRIAEETEKLKMEQLQLSLSGNRRLAELEYDHGQRIIQINRDIGRAVAEAAAEAAEARIKSGTKLAESLAEIESGLARDKATAQADYNSAIQKLNQDRRDAERDLQRGIRDVNLELQDDIKKLHVDAEDDKTKITQQAADKRLGIEKKYADLRARVDDEYTGEFEGADAFRRKILAFNRDEKLRLLGEEEAAEQTALESQTQTALTELTERVTAEEAILNEQAQRKRDRLKEEFNDKKAALQLERNELAASLAAEQAQLDEAAAIARAKAQEQNAQELARIDQQEAEKTAKAQEALAREDQQHQERLASLQRSQAQERALLDAQLRALEMQRQAGYLRQIAEAQRFAQQMQQILSNIGVASSGSSAPGGSVGDTINNNTVNVDAGNNPGGWAGAMQEGRTIAQILAGF